MGFQGKSERSTLAQRVHLRFAQDVGCHLMLVVSGKVGQSVLFDVVNAQVSYFTVN